MRLLSVFLLFLLFSGCYQVKRDCKSFKTGSFKFEALVGTQILTTTFVRNDSIEIDFFEGKSDTSAIRWINDCEYIVTKLRPRNRNEEKAIHIKILTTEDDTYTFEYGVVGETRKEKGVAQKINN